MIAKMKQKYSKINIFLLIDIFQRDTFDSLMKRFDELSLISIIKTKLYVYKLRDEQTYESIHLMTYFFVYFQESSDFYDEIDDIH